MANKGRPGESFVRRGTLQDDVWGFRRKMGGRTKFHTPEEIK